MFVYSMKVKLNGGNICKKSINEDTQVYVVYKLLIWLNYFEHLFYRIKQTFINLN